MGFLSSNPTIDKVVKVDRYLLSKMFWDLLQKLACRDPSTWDKMIVNMAYNKIIAGMERMDDDQLMAYMNDVIETVDYARLNILPPKEGYYRK